MGQIRFIAICEVTKAAGGVKYSNCAVDGSPLFVSLSHNKRGVGACPESCPERSQRGSRWVGGEWNSWSEARHLRHRAHGWRPRGDVIGRVAVSLPAAVKGAGLDFRAAYVHADERTGGGPYPMR